MFVNDGTEFTIGGRNSGIVIRYRGNIRGFMLLIGTHEFSYFNYSRISKLSWNCIIRVPFRSRAIRW